MDTSTSPPVERDESAEPTETRWPRVIGTISIIYASVGLFCQTTQALMAVFMDWFMGLFGAEVSLPAGPKVAALVSAVIIWVLGIMLIMGGVRLGRRVRSGVVLLKRWAILRIVMLVIGAAVSIVFLPATLEAQRAMQEAGNDRLREQGREDMVQPFDEDAKWRQSLIGTLIASGVLSIYPLFVTFYLDRRTIKEEVEAWT